MIRITAMTDLETYLRSALGISAADMGTLVSYFHLTELKKGEYFLKAGRICDKLSFHRSGLMRVYASYGDKEITQWISFKGNLSAHLGGIVFDEPSGFNFQALTYCELY